MNAATMAQTILRTHPDRPTLFASVVARQFSGHVARAATDPRRGVAELTTWIEELCGRYPVDVRCLEMLRRSCEQPALGAVDDARVRSMLRGFEPVIASLIVRAGSAIAHGTLAEEVLDGTISAFLVRLDDADPLTAEHSRAVSLWCRRLAQRLGFASGAAQFAARCGLLHDVGKSRTPNAILNAPRQLTPDEWDVMRDHTVAGAAMLEEIEALQPFAIAARSHHERMDGKGYPDKIPALALPQAVRIVSVADAFNAMIGRRPYRLPLSPALALEQLVKHRETQFDPDVVDAMIDIVERPEEILTRAPGSRAESSREP